MSIYPVHPNCVLLRYFGRTVASYWALAAAASAAALLEAASSAALCTKRRCVQNRPAERAFNRDPFGPALPKA